MRLSKLIKKLEELKETCGDSQVKLYSDTNDTFEHVSTVLPDKNYSEVLIVGVK